MSETVTASTRVRLLSRRRTWVLAAGAVALATLITVLLVRRDDHIQYLGAKVQRGEIKDAVESTGIVNAVVNVQVGSQVSGTIAKLNADFNSRVRKGDVIALIDPQLFQGAVLQATADLDNAKSNVVAAKANLEKAKSTLVQTNADFERATAMTEKGIGTQQALDLAKANFQSAKSGVDAAVASVAQANAQVSQKEAAVAVARTNLNYTIIRSPIDGIVVARNVDVGQTVAASLQAPTIFTIAQDLSKMLVYAKVDESDVGRIRSGQHVTFKVDAFPKEANAGTVTQVRMNPTSVQNVVTYDVIISFDNPQLKLFPGMTAYVTIPIATVENVTKLPNAALRFKPPLPPETVRSLYAQYGIDVSRQREAPLASGINGSDSGASTQRNPRQGREESAVVWRLLADGTVEPVDVALGITDHAYTEVTRLITGTLKPGDEVVTSAVASKSAPPGAQGIRR